MQVQASVGEGVQQERRTTKKIKTNGKDWGWERGEAKKKVTRRHCKNAQREQERLNNLKRNRNYVRSTHSPHDDKYMGSKETS